MRRRVLMAVLALGVVGGYGSAAVRVAHCARERREAMRQHMLHEVRGACADGARAGVEGKPMAAPSGWHDAPRF